MPMKPKLISSRTIYQGHIFQVRVDKLDDGEHEYEREVVVHAGSAVIVPLFEDGTVALVRQYRHAAGRTLLELPAGRLDPGETAEEGALRELEEEIGYRAGELQKLAQFYVSPGFLDERMDVFLATGLVETQQNLDHDEDIEIERIPLARAVEMARSGEIEDAKTMIGLIKAAELEN